eukprot:1039615-Rhodomonas_salina.2
MRRTVGVATCPEASASCRKPGGSMTCFRPGCCRANAADDRIAAASFGHNNRTGGMLPARRALPSSRHPAPHAAGIGLATHAAAGRVSTRHSRSTRAWVSVEHRLCDCTRRRRDLHLCCSSEAYRLNTSD